MMDLMPSDFTAVNSTLPAFAMIPNQQCRTSQGTMSYSTSQQSSRTAKSDKFALLSRAIKHSDIHLEVLFLQNSKFLEYFFCFHRTLGISPKDLEECKADIVSFCWLPISTNLNFDFTFVTRNFIGSCVIRYVFDWLVVKILSRAGIETIFLDQEVNKQNFPSFVELILRNIL